MATNRPFVVDPVLTAVAIGYKNGSAMRIADQVLPRLPVAGEKFKYTVYPIAEAFNTPDARVGRRGAVKQLEFTGTEVTSDVADYGLDSPIPQSDIDVATSARAQGRTVFDPEARATEMLTETIENIRELRAAQLVFALDWSDTASRVQLFAGSLGEVSRGPTAFRAEMRGLSHYLGQEVGRIYSRRCDAALGDSRCTVDLENPVFKGTGTVVSSSDARILTASGLAAFASGLFTNGTLVWSTGANAGLRVAVFAHRLDTALRLELAERAVRPIAIGDIFVIRAGCDKQASTCAGRFANLVNFRGFPHMPGNDTAFSYITSEQTHDGGSFFK